MYNNSQLQSHSQTSRSPVDPQQQQQQQHQQQPPHPPQQHQHYAGSSLYPYPTISHHSPTPTSLYPQQQPSQIDLLNPSAPRLRSGSGSLATEPQPDPSSLRRSGSLNDAMSNPSTGYYGPQMASPMGSYPQGQMYSQSSIPQSNYYQSLPQLSVHSFDQSRQQMRPLSGNYDYSQQLPYSQPSYPQNNYATSYQSASSMMAPSSSPYSSQPAMAGSPAGMSYVGRPSPPATLSGAPVHVVDRQKKPQCWDHGCNGREFSTFSNLLRHQREKSGTAAKSYCPHCGAEFTRTTARNGHMEHGKCKTRRQQGGSSQ